MRSPYLDDMEKREEILKLFRGLRVSDVSDGMDAVGLQDVGSMDPDIKPLWRDIENFKHRIYGIAYTVRFVPTRLRVGLHLNEEPDFEKFREWVRYGYSLAKAPILEQIRKGDVIVIDAKGTGHAGFIGSNNSLSWVLRGAVGVVTNGGARDTDEIIKQQIPVYCKYTGKGIRPGRLELESINATIECGGVQVRPGDIVVADGDGVIVVPWEKARLVAEEARKIAEEDKKSRRRLYQELGRPLDWTVEPLEK